MTTMVVCESQAPSTASRAAVRKCFRMDARTEFPRRECIRRATRGRVALRTPDQSRWRLRRALFPAEVVRIELVELRLASGSRQLFLRLH